MHSFVAIQRMTSKQNPLINLFIDAILETTEIERDFVFIASNLTWNKQINHKWEIFTWNKLLGYTRRNTRFIENTAVRSILYLALVRAHMGYAKKIWAPQSIEQITQLERTKTSETKYILNLPFFCDMDYNMHEVALLIHSF